MNVSIQCPQCGTASSVQPSAQRTALVCPDCGTRFAVWADVRCVSETSTPGRSDRSKEWTIAGELPDGQRHDFKFDGDSALQVEPGQSFSIVYERGRMPGALKPSRLHNHSSRRSWALGGSRRPARA